MPEYQDILDYWGGSGPRPSQAAARAALFAQAEALKIENCELRPGVIPALLDPNFTQVATPFGNLTVPGAVPAAYYDLGSNGIAYVDAEYKNEAGGGGTVWNQGYAFRNDGVDLEACSDPSGAAYNVGWTAVGERLYYTVNVLEAGTYYLGMRVASQDGNGKFRLLLDGAALGGEVVVPQTGGWQSWTNIQVTDIPLPAGRHQFGILITESGFNINLFTFLRTGGTGIGDPEELSPQGFHLEQNYPNPFNGETRIRFFLPSASRVNLSVYNLLGGLTEELLATEMSPGLHEVTWDGEDTASGIYFLKLTSPLGTRIRTLHLVR